MFKQVFKPGFGYFAIAKSRPEIIPFSYKDFHEIGKLDRLIYPALMVVKSK